MPTTKTRQRLPKVLIAGRGEHWTDYGHHESGIVYGWVRGQGFETLPGTYLHSALERGGTIVGRIDGALATMRINVDVSDDEIAEFLLDMASEFPRVRQIRNFID
jgi:hypothetical protein